MYAMLHPRRAKASSAPWWKPEISYTVDEIKYNIKQKY
jgi:hypothetical protein